MKKIILLFGIIVCLSSCSNRVYVCTGGYSYRYHKSKSCDGLSNCGGEIKEVSKEEAKSIGRTPCRMCY